MPRPLGELKYLYVGSGRFDDDLAYFRDVLGGRLVWNLAGFGARVAAFDLAKGPLLLIADHRRAPSVLPVYAVKGLEALIRAWRTRGWKEKQGPIEIPDGPCYTFEDPSGNEYAVFQNDRPDALLHERRAPEQTGKRKKMSSRSR